MLKVRRAALSDATPIASLVTQLGYPTGPDDMVDRLKRLLDDPRHTVLVADADGAIVAMGSAAVDYSPQHDGPSVRIIAMVVDANARGRGVGAFLVQQIEEWARERGAERVTLTSASHRTDAYKFYEAIGYQVTGTRFMKRV